MRHSTLVAFQEGQLPSARFVAEITPEVDACSAAIEATGHGRIIMIPDGSKILLTRDHARRLLRAMSDATLSPRAASYVADCIIMGRRFETDESDDAPLEAIHFAADDSAPPTAEEIASALAHLD
jgi:hypothetical protein